MTHSTRHMTLGMPQVRHNYQRRIDELLRAGLFVDLPVGGVFRLAVIHDDHCAFFHGGWCNCQPDFELQDMTSSVEATV